LFASLAQYSGLLFTHTITQPLAVMLPSAEDNNEVILSMETLLLLLLLVENDQWVGFLVENDQ
jgi:hypothetical protein